MIEKTLSGMEASETRITSPASWMSSRLTAISEGMSRGRALDLQFAQELDDGRADDNPDRGGVSGEDDGNGGRNLVGHIHVEEVNVEHVAAKGVPLDLSDEGEPAGPSARAMSKILVCSCRLAPELDRGSYPRTEEPGIQCLTVDVDRDNSGFTE